jgi:hypothetical protein
VDVLLADLVAAEPEKWYQLFTWYCISVISGWRLRIQMPPPFQ